VWCIYNNVHAFKFEKSKLPMVSVLCQKKCVQLSSLEFEFEILCCLYVLFIQKEMLLVHFRCYLLLGYRPTNEYT